MIGDLKTDAKGKIVEEKSDFQPSSEIMEFTGRVKQDYQTGWDIQHRTFEEFNDVDILRRMDIDQKRFNGYVPQRSNDPDEAWRFDGIRLTARNKILSIAAHMTTAILFPNTFAQNDLNEEDKGAANVMSDLIKWNIRNSDYGISFLFAVFGALINPCTYLGADYVEAVQLIKKRADNGEITQEEAVDEVLSGFQASNIPVEEMLIANPYEYEHQKQRFVIRRRFLDYSELETIWGDHKNFTFVSPGIKTVFDDGSETFYNQKDESLQTLGEEVRYWNRLDDTEVVFVNGIYMGRDKVFDNRFVHRDNLDRPKYPHAKSGYRPIDEKHFYYFKSASDELQWDDLLVNRMWQLTMDGTFLDVMPPSITSGEDTVDKSVYFPGRVTALREGTEITPLKTGGNLNSGYNAIQAAENSMSETSQDASRAGVATPGSQTAFEFSKLDQNARIQLGIFGKMIGKLIVDFGHLMIDDILKHQTISQAEEILGGRTKLNFRTFVLPDEVEDGKTITKKIMFTDDFMGLELDDDQILNMSFTILDKDGIDGEEKLTKVNPFLFSRLKFLLTVDADKLLPKNEAFEKAFKLEAFDRMIQSPLVDPEAVTRDFLVSPFAGGEVDKYMKKAGDLGLQDILEQKVGGQGNTSPLVDQATGAETSSLNSLLTTGS